MDVLGEQRQDFHKTLSETGQKNPKQTKQLVFCSLNDGYFCSNFVNMSDFSYLVARFSHRIYKRLHKSFHL